MYNIVNVMFLAIYFKIKTDIVSSQNCIQLFVIEFKCNTCITITYYDHNDEVYSKSTIQQTVGPLFKKMFKITVTMFKLK